MDNKMIGEKIAIARKTQNLSQAQVAQQVFVSPQAVGKWERGESLPDLITLERLATLLGVDLNYFSNRWDSQPQSPSHLAAPEAEFKQAIAPVERMPLNMSHGNWVDADFSGLSNLHEKFNGANMQRCQFVGAELSGLQLKGNHVDNCNFANANLGHSRLSGCNLVSNQLVDCSLKETEFSGTALKGCDLSGADLSGAAFRGCDFRKNTVAGTQLFRTIFKDSHLTDIVFEGEMDQCHFENCSFTRVVFRNCRFYGAFFKGVRLKNVQFENCQADNISYAFLKSGKANLEGITLLS